MNTSETIGAIAKALAAAQAEIENVTTDAKNDFFQKTDANGKKKASTYATLAAVLDECRPVLSKNGIAVIQSPGNDGELVTVTTRLIHESGEWMESTVGVKPAKFDAQGLGAVVTYLRRFALAAFCGVAQEDDDGNAASANATAPSRPAGVQGGSQTRPAQNNAAQGNVSDAQREENARKMFAVVREFGNDGDAEAWEMVDKQDKMAMYRRACARAKEINAGFVAPV